MSANRTFPPSGIGRFPGRLKWFSDTFHRLWIELIGISCRGE